MECECIIYVCRGLSFAAVLLCFKICLAPFGNMRINTYLNQKDVRKCFCITAALSHVGTLLMKRQFLIALKRYGGRNESQIFTEKILSKEMKILNSETCRATLPPSGLRKNYNMRALT